MTNDMTNENDYEETRLDKILLILRRVFLVLFIFLVVWIILFKILKINKNNNTDANESMETITWNIVNQEIEIDKNELWNDYRIDGKNILYKWEVVEFADAKTFKIINKNEIDGTIINSNNLLRIFADYETRAWLMNNIDKIINKKENVTNELKKSSENGMYDMKNDYKKLSGLNRNDRYDMTDEQRSKFAIMFLYIKIIKKQNNGEITTSKAVNELKLFLENFDKKDLVKEVEDKKINKIKGDIWVDDDCLYVNGELYACFLDGLFVK